MSDANERGVASALRRHEISEQAVRVAAKIAAQAEREVHLVGVAVNDMLTDLAKGVEKRVTSDRGVERTKYIGLSRVGGGDDVRTPRLEQRKPDER